MEELNLKFVTPVQLQEGEQVWIETPHGVVMIQALKTKHGDGLTLITGFVSGPHASTEVEALAEPQATGGRAFVVSLRERSQ